MKNISGKSGSNHYFLLLVVCLFCGSINGQAQILVRNKIEKNIIFGMHTGGEGTQYKDPVSSEEFKHSIVYLEPYLGYFFNRNFGVGTIFGYNRFRSSFSEDYDLFEIGGFARYYIPIGLNPDWPISMLFLSELSYRASNYQQINRSDFNQSEGLNYNILTLTPIGAQIKIWKGFYGEISTEWVFHAPAYDHFSYRIGLEYHFGDERRAR